VASLATRNDDGNLAGLVDLDHLNVSGGLRRGWRVGEDDK
jgi:hypothetical protein